MKFEILYYQQASAISPKHFPEIFYQDYDAMMVIVMQDLNKHQVMREGLLLPTQYPKFAKHMGKFLAHMLFNTSALVLHESQHEALNERFAGNTLCKLTDDFVFTFPFITGHEMNYLKDVVFSAEFCENANALHVIFCSRADALIHGDLHTGSIMLNQEETYIIDSEFSFVGPMGFDLGLLLANLLTMWAAYSVKKTNESYQEGILKAIQNLFNVFNTEFLKLWNVHTENTQGQLTYMQNILSESVGFAGLEMCRRVCGTAGVKEIRGIQDPDIKDCAQQLVLAIGQEFVENYRVFASVDNVIVTAQQIQQKLGKIILESASSTPPSPLLTK